MDRKLIIHVGSPKTGSTALQYSLKQGEDRIKAAGFCYPTGSNINHTHLYRSFISSRAGPEFRKALKSLLIDYQSFPSTILSSEFFFFLTEDSLRKFCKVAAEVACVDTVKIVSYVRPQDEYIESQIRQNATVMDFDHRRKIENFNLWLPHLPLNYMAFYEHHQSMERVVGVGNVVARGYSRSALVKGDIASDFAKAIKLPIELTSVNGVNSSLTAEEALLLSMVRARMKAPNSKNYWPTSSDERAQLGKTYAAVLKRPMIRNLPRSGNELISIQEKNAIRNFFRNDTERFCDKWMPEHKSWFCDPVSSDLKKVTPHSLSQMDLAGVVADLTEEVASLRNELRVFKKGHDS